MKRSCNTAIKFIWWIYIVLLFTIVIIKFRGSFKDLSNRIMLIPFGTNYNLVPFLTIKRYINNFSEGWAKYNIFGNIVPFIPFGFLLPVVYQKVNTLKKVFISGISFVLIIEFIQFFYKIRLF